MEISEAKLEKDANEILATVRDVFPSAKIIDEPARAAVAPEIRRLAESGVERKVKPRPEVESAFIEHRRETLPTRANQSSSSGRLSIAQIKECYRISAA